jgi:predicted PurR-regulated permease PerM
MSNYKQPTKLSPMVYFLVFLGIVSIAFAVFFTVLARPLCNLKNRMNNTQTDWQQIRENIVKINYGDSPKRVKELIGEPDETFQSLNQTIYSYQKYGIYKPSFFYEIEFRDDTLFQIIAHD